MMRFRLNAKRLGVAAMIAVMLMTATSCGKEKPSQQTTEQKNTEAETEEIVSTEAIVTTEDESVDEGIKYASDYDLDVKSTHSNVKNKWNIRKSEDDGEIMLFIHAENSNREEPIDYLNFRVYDDTDAAKAYFDEIYDKSKEYDRGKYWEDGGNWFISKEPGVTDAAVIWIVYRQGNVIISADLKDIPIGKKDSKDENFDEKNLKDYIINNAPEIKRTIIEDALDYK